MHSNIQQKKCGVAQKKHLPESKTLSEYFPIPQSLLNASSMKIGWLLDPVRIHF